MSEVDVNDKETKRPKGKAAPVEDEPPWVEMRWHGLRMLRCKLCPYDTLEGEEAMIVHIEAHHAPEPPPPPLVQAFDARGNPI